MQYHQSMTLDRKSYLAAFDETIPFYLLVYIFKKHNLTFTCHLNKDDLVNCPHQASIRWLAVFVPYR